MANTQQVTLALHVYAESAVRARHPQWGDVDYPLSAEFLASLTESELRVVAKHMIGRVNNPRRLPCPTGRASSDEDALAAVRAQVERDVEQQRVDAVDAEAARVVRLRRHAEALEVLEVEAEEARALAAAAQRLYDADPDTVPARVEAPSSTDYVPLRIEVRKGEFVTRYAWGDTAALQSTPEAEAVKRAHASATEACNTIARKLGERYQQREREQRGWRHLCAALGSIGCAAALAQWVRENADALAVQRLDAGFLAQSEAEALLAKAFWEGVDSTHATTVGDDFYGDKGHQGPAESLDELEFSRHRALCDWLNGECRAFGAEYEMALQRWVDDDDDDDEGSHVVAEVRVRLHGRTLERDLNLSA